MATLKQDLLRSTYQQNQLAAILSIEDILSDIRDVGKSRWNYISKNGIVADIDDSFSELARVITATGTATERSNERSYRKITERLDTIHRTQRSQGDQNNDREDYQGERLYRQKTLAHQSSIQEIVRKVYNTVNSFLTMIGLSVDQLIDNSQALMKYTNSMIYNTGFTRDAVKEYRDSLRVTVDSLNDKYDGVFNYLDVIDLMTTVTNQTGIKDLDFLQEYSEMFLKTSKSMNIHLGTLAEFSDKFYKRYGFSSKSMEDLMTSIRKNTAGTSVTDEQAMNFLIQNEETITDYAYMYARRTGEDYQDVVAKIEDSLTGVITYFDKVGLEEDQRNILMNQLFEAAKGNMDSIGVLQALSMDTVGLMDRLMTNPDALVQDLVDRLAAFGRLQYQNYDFSKGISESYGLGEDLSTIAKQLEKTMTYGRYTSVGEYKDSKDDNTTLSSDPIEEYWLPEFERTANNMSTRIEDIADFQESYGVDLGYIRKIYDILSKVWGFSGLSLFSSFLSSVLFGSGGGTLLSGIGSLFGESGSLAGLGKAGIIALALAAIGTSAANIYTNLKDRYEKESNDMSEINQQLFDLSEDSVTRIGYENKGKGVDITSTHTISDQDVMPELKVEDFIKEWESAYESSTGYKVMRSGDIGAFGTNLLRSLVGPGWWMEGGTDSILSNGSSKIPLLSSIGHLVIDAFNKITGKEDDNAALAYAAYNRDVYGRRSGPSFMKAFLNELTEAGKSKDDLLTLYTAKYEDDIRRAISNRKIPMSVTDKGISDLIDIDKTKYKDYYEQYLKGEIPFYKLGTRYVPEDQLAVVHEGEAIIPRDSNPFTNENSIFIDSDSMSPLYAGVSDLSNSIEDFSASLSEYNSIDNRVTHDYPVLDFSRDTSYIVSELSRSRVENSESTSQISEVLSSIEEYSRRILEFIGQWKSESEYREDLRDAKTRLGTNNVPVDTVAFG